MYKRYRNGPGIKLSDIDNEFTLNIFTDASIINRKDHYDGCYGAIAVYNDKIIDQIIRIASNSTNNNSEIKGLRAGVYLALKHRAIYKTINIFSDSQISVFGVRDRLLNWKVNQVDQKLINKSGDPVSNQDVYLEIAYIMTDNNIRINFMHQKGHVSTHIDSLFNAQHVFGTSNGIRGKIDLNLIRFISKWNNIIDEITRDNLKRYDCSTIYSDPITFLLAPFDRALYSKLSKNTVNKGVL